MSAENPANRPTSTAAEPAWTDRATLERWQRGAAAREAVFNQAADLLLDLARVGPGSRVLDVAAGAGSQTLQAARRIGVHGHLLATDISAAMLTVAAETVRAAGLSNVETRVMDAHRLELADETFDAVI